MIKVNSVKVKFKLQTIETQYLTLIIFNVINKIN